MLRWAFAFFLLALVSALLGSADLKIASIARLLFFPFLAIFLVMFVSALAGAGRGRSTA